MKSGLRLLGFVVGAALLLYFLYFCAVSFDWSALRRLASWPTALAWLAATLLYCTVVPASAMAWRRLLPEGRKRGFGELCGIMGATQLAKYVPGNVAQFAGRSALSLGRGMPLPDFVASVTVETVLAVLAGLIVGMWGARVGMALPAPAWVGHALPWGVAALTIGLLATPRLLALLERPMQRRPWLSGVSALRASLPGLPAQAFAIAAYCGNYLLIGVGLLLLSRGVGLSFGYAELTAAFTLSWLIGFFSPGMPAGIGTREGAMALLLGGSGSGNAELAGIVLAMRLATISGDLAWFAIGGWLLSRRGGRNE